MVGLDVWAKGWIFSGATKLVRGNIELEHEMRS